MERERVDLRDDTRTTPSSRVVTSEPSTRRLPETKTFLASSEFWVMIAGAVALFFAGYVLNEITNATAWKYGTWIAIAYIVSRGLAKAGSQRSYDGPWDRDR